MQPSKKCRFHAVTVDKREIDHHHQQLGMSEEHNQDTGYEETDKTLMLAYETKKKYLF